MTNSLSLWSEGSFLSVASKGSVLSIGSVGSVGSIGSIGSAGSFLSIASAALAGSVMSWASAGSVLSSQSRDAVLGDPRRGRAGLLSAGILALCGAAIAAWRCTGDSPNGATPRASRSRGRPSEARLPRSSRRWSWR